MGPPTAPLTSSRRVASGINPAGPTLLGCLLLKRAEPSGAAHWNTIRSPPCHNVMLRDEEIAPKVGSEHNNLGREYGLRIGSLGVAWRGVACSESGIRKEAHCAGLLFTRHHILGRCRCALSR